MLRNHHLLERYLELPRGLSDAERSELVEQARYETFNQPGVTARMTLVSVLVTVGALLGVATVALALYALAPTATAGPVTRAVLIGIAVLAVISITNMMQQKYRAKLLRPAVDRLLQSRSPANR